jgi:transposase
VAEIRKITKLDRKTIDKYLAKNDFSVTVEDQAFTPAKSKLDPYKPIIDKLLEKERGYFHKQHFTAVRMLEYLTDMGSLPGGLCIATSLEGCRPQVRHITEHCILLEAQDP